MVIGMLLAGGKGLRVGAELPKQFIEVNDKPIIAYPLEIMNTHPLIDSILVVCIDNCIPQLSSIASKYKLNKVKWVISGGSTCQQSTKIGIDFLKDKIDRNDTLLIHMASYPLCPASVITNCILSAQKNGNGCTAKKILYSVYYTEDKKTSVKQIDRDELMFCTAPYAFNYGECSELYDLAFKEGKGITGNVYTNTLYCDYGKRIFFVDDVNRNIKITNQEDLIFMKALLDHK